MQSLELRSRVSRETTGAGRLELSLHEVDVPPPGPDEVLVQIEAAPINPSDIGLLFGPADLGALRASPDAAGRPRLEAPIAPEALAGVAGRIGQALPVGNEGAGLVLQGGASATAQALAGRRVAVFGGGMYAQHRCVPLAQCLPLPEGASAADGASCFVNPLTALGMVETMRREGHRGLVHTAAASNLGLMLQRICRQDGIPLVNIVRRAEQAAPLREAGAEHVCSTDSPHFIAELTDALAATGATLGFDATGGGPLAGQILGAMEAAIARSRPHAPYSRYGSDVPKQVYVYGGLEPGPTTLVRNFGFTWRLGGWLLFSFLQQLEPARVQALKARVAAELHTTFRSRYAGELSLAGMLDPAQVAVYAQRRTGGKFLLDPRRPAG